MKNRAAKWLAAACSTHFGHRKEVLKWVTRTVANRDPEVEWVSLHAAVNSTHPFTGRRKKAFRKAICRMRVAAECGPQPSVPAQELFKSHPTTGTCNNQLSVGAIR